MKILVVDDSRTQQMALTAILRAEGPWEVVVVSSVSEALDVLRSGTEIDLILMDVVMPEMDGVQGCRLIKSCFDFADIPIIMVTIKRDEETLRQAFDAGAMDYINKPLSRVEVGARVRSALRLKYEMDRRKSREKKLRDALTNVKQLSGLLPICAHCKKIRNDEGYWQQIEQYILEHSEADFSHGVCPECKEKLYAEAFEEPE